MFHPLVVDDGRFRVLPPSLKLNKLRLDRPKLSHASYKAKVEGHASHAGYRSFAEGRDSPVSLLSFLEPAEIGASLI
jgi:hypothetical protein